MQEKITDEKTDENKYYTMIATAHKIDNRWIALPSLTVDFFIGAMVPNENHIRENLVPFKEGTNTDNLKENQIIYGRVIDCYDENGKMNLEFKLLDEDGKKHMI